MCKLYYYDNFQRKKASEAFNNYSIHSNYADIDPLINQQLKIKTIEIILYYF